MVNREVVWTVADRLAKARKDAERVRGAAGATPPVDHVNSDLPPR
jgi:hypothetical protein